MDQKKYHAGGKKWLQEKKKSICYLQLSISLNFNKRTY